MTVMIGVDPHKGSHTAVAVAGGERSLAELRVRSGPKQLERLLRWAQRFPERTWAVENATGLGYLLAQQLVGAGEQVLHVQPKLAARVRQLATESTNKNDPHDALLVAVAALRSPSPKVVGVEDHAAVMKLWARRHRNLSSTRTQVACRLHAVLCELVAGGGPDEIYASKAQQLLADVTPQTVEAARVELAEELLDDLRRVDGQLAESKKRLEQVVAASGTTTANIFGVGPVVAATVVGLTGDSTRFPTRDRFAAFNGTAPIEVEAARSGDSPGGGTAPSTTPSTWPPSPRSDGGTASAAPTTTARSPRARLPRRRCGLSSAASATPCGPPWSPTPNAPPPSPDRHRRRRAREGNRGTTLSPARPAHTPRHRLFGQATPEPAPRLGPPKRARDE
jgi:transposase